MSTLASSENGFETGLHSSSETSGNANKVFLTRPGRRTDDSIHKPVTVSPGGQSTRTVGVPKGSLCHLATGGICQRVGTPGVRSRKTYSPVLYFHYGLAQVCTAPAEMHPLGGDYGRKSSDSHRPDETQSAKAIAFEQISPLSQLVANSALLSFQS